MTIDLQDDKGDTIHVVIDNDGFKWEESNDTIVRAIMEGRWIDDDEGKKSIDDGEVWWIIRRR